MIGKLIVIEGTDCSGKETQTKKLLGRLNDKGIKTYYFSYPNYSSPTGKIVGGPYLGKKEIGPCWFKEGAVNVDPYVSSLYYAADRKYNIDSILHLLNNGSNVILDRYVYSNMAHQGSKLSSKSAREEIYSFLEQLEFNLLKLPVPDIKIFLHMPNHFAKILKQNRESIDEHEKDEDYLIKAEKTYIEIADVYDFKTIECVSNNEIRSIDNISDEVFSFVLDRIDDNGNNRTSWE